MGVGAFVIGLSQISFFLSLFILLQIRFSAWVHTDIIRTTTSQLSRMCFVGTDSDSVWSVNHSAFELPCVMADLSFTSNIISVLTALYKFKHS